MARSWCGEISGHGRGVRSEEEKGCGRGGQGGCGVVDAGCGRGEYLLCKF